MARLCSFLQPYSWLLSHLEWVAFRSSSVLPESGILPGTLPGCSVPRLCTFQQWVQCGLVPTDFPQAQATSPGTESSESWEWIAAETPTPPPPAHAWSLGPGSETVIGRLTYGVSVLHFISEHRPHQIFPRRKMWGSSPWRSREAVCVSNVTDPWMVAAHCLCTLPHHRHALLGALPDKPHKHNLLISSYLPTNSQFRKVWIDAFLILYLISRWRVANSMWLLFRMEPISTFEHKNTIQTINILKKFREMISCVGKNPSFRHR